MKTILKSIQTKLSEVSELKYIDEDWGQLDYYSAHPPTQFPLALIEIATANYSNIGIQRQSSPQNRQMAQATLVITVANLKLTNTSLQAPITQQNQAWTIYDILESIHEKIHGFAPVENCSKLIRTGYKRIKRDDGIQEYELTYKLELSNV
jgi:hypothetical protein